MTKALIITVAGESTRFRKSINKDVLKSLYSAEKKLCILDILIKNTIDKFEEIVIVGGYKFLDLKSHVEKKYNSKKIKLIFNKNYKLGSNLSLINGVNSLDRKFDQIVFIEGDLIVDKNSLNEIIDSKKNVISYNKLPIKASVSVVYYTNLKNQVLYRYDPLHNSLEINEPFKNIANSAQIWKFLNQDLLKETCSKFTINDFKETNLKTIENYFIKTDYSDIDFIQVEDWYNCNTIEDYNLGIKNANY